MIRPARLAQEMGRQSGDIVQALTQRRHVHRKNQQPVVQILAEPAGGNGRLQRAVGGGDHPHVDLAFAGIADPVDLPLLQHSQQLGLDPGAGLPDLVQEKGAAVRRLEQSFAILVGAGESALAIAE